MSAPIDQISHTLGSIEAQVTLLTSRTERFQIIQERLSEEIAGMAPILTRIELAGGEREKRLDALERLASKLTGISLVVSAFSGIVTAWLKERFTL
jgi:hypothetical protein